MPLHRSPPAWWPRPLAVGLLLVLLTGASQAETWVITDKAHPVSATGSSRVLFLDAQEHLE
ncbi:TPA: TIGR03757 family integrating conjugative element protein, partial [Pseudomonas aeruginosa]